MKVTRWAFRTVDYYESECYRDSLEMGLKLFDSKLKAMEELNRVIREDWTTEVDVNGETKMLADCYGMSEDDSIKYSAWYYSEDGMLAWSFYDNGSGHKGEVVEVDLKKAVEK